MSHGPSDFALVEDGRPSRRSGSPNDAGYDGYVDVEFVSDELPYEESVRTDYEFVRSVIDGLD